MDIEQMEREEVEEVESELASDEEIDEMSDLWQALGYLDRCLDIFDEVLTDETPLPMELVNKIYNVDRVARKFVQEWDLDNAEET